VSLWWGYKRDRKQEKITKEKIYTYLFRVLSGGDTREINGQGEGPVSIISKSISSTAHQLVDDSLNSMVI
jgi:hypothetical protein